MRHVLLQLATGEPYESMMDLTKEHHHAYCEEFGWEFSPRKQFIRHEPFIDRSMGEMFMAQALGEYKDGDVLCFLPADAIIMSKLGIDLRDAIPDHIDIAMFGNIHFVNSGFALVRNSPAVRELLARVIAKGPLDGNADISARMADELRASSLAIQYLGSAWQWFEYGSVLVDCPEEEAVIRAWHGGSRYKALKEMKVVMAGILEGVV